MKKGIHPKYGPAVIRCACGNTLETISTAVSYTHLTLPTSDLV